MHISLPIFIGWRFAKARRKSIMASFISFASSIGIALGVMVLIVGLSAMNGFEKELNHRVLGIIPSGEISAENPLINVKQALEIVREEKVVLAASPVVATQGIISQNNIFKVSLLRGIDPALEKDVLNIEEFLFPRGLDLLADPQANNIILGDKIAQKLGVKVGDKVELIISQADQNGRLQAPTGEFFTVVSLLHIGGELDGMISLMHIANARKLMHMGNDEATAISLRLSDNYKADLQVRSAARSIVKTQPDAVYVSTWMSTQYHLYHDIQMIRSILYLALVMVVCVACFNIVSSLIMSVNEKRSEIAILMSMGYTRTQVLYTFVVLGMRSGCLGTMVGTILGIGLAWQLTNVVKIIEAVLGIQVLDGNVYFIDFIPSDVHVMDVALVASVAIVLSLIASVAPAYMSTRVHPATELSGK